MHWARGEADPTHAQEARRNGAPRWSDGALGFVELFRAGHPQLPLASSEGEGKCLHAGVKKLDDKGVVGDRPLQPHELIEAVLGDDAIASGVGVHSMTFSRSLAIDGHAKANLLCRQSQVPSTRCRSRA